MSEISFKTHRAPRRGRACLLAFLTLLPALAALASPAAADTTYTQGAVLPGARHATSAVWNGTHAFVFGGRGTGLFYNDVVRYDPANDTIRTMNATLGSFGLAYSAAAWDGTYAYVIGGTYPNGSRSDKILRYHPATDSMTTMSARLPETLTEVAAVYDGAHVYVLGGWNGGFRATIYRYDPATDTLANTGAALPTGRSASAAAYLNGSVYVFGGLNGCSPSCHMVEQAVKYTPATNAVTDLGWLHGRGLMYPRAVSSGSEIYVFGGRTADWVTDWIDRYDAATNTLTRMAPVLPTPRHDTAAVWANGEALVFGGLNGVFDGTKYDTIVRYNLTFPSPPHSVTVATAGTANLSVSWSPHHVDSSLLGYRLWRRDPNGVETQVAFTAAGQTSHLDTGLKTGATYSYSVSAVNAAGMSLRSASGSGVPLDFRFQDNVELGPGQWSVTDAGGAGSWAPTSQRFASPMTSFGITGAHGYANLSDDSLVSMPIDLTRLSSGSPRLTFKHLAFGEQKCALLCVNTDYGAVGVSGDGGATWTNLKTGIHTTNGAWATESFSLDPWRGQQVLLRFRWISDPLVANEGWFVDDVVVHGHTNDAPFVSFSTSANGLTLAANATGSNDVDGDALTYSWSWGDGTAAGTGIAPTHAYASPGIYTVTLTASDGRGASAATSRIVDVMSLGRVERFSDDMENGTSKWLVTNVAGSGTWQNSNLRSASPSRSFGISGYGANSLDLLQTAAPVDLTGLAPDLPVTLRFRHFAEGETCLLAAAGCAPVDHGRVEVSANGGADWTSLLEGVHDTDGAWRLEHLDLSAWRNQSILVRFVWTSDGANAFQGWSVDDVQVIGAQNAPPVPVIQITGQWNRTVSVSAAASSDADGDALTYAWDWGDGTGAAGMTATRAYANEASYLVKLTVTDARGSSAAAHLRVLAAPWWYEVPVFDDAEGGLANWSVTDNGGAGTWAISAARSWSPTRSIAITGYGASSDDTLTSGWIDLRDRASAALDFRHYADGQAYACVDDICVPADSGAVEISTDYGLTWTPLKSGMSSTDGQWRRERVDLAPYLGQQVHLRFRWTSDLEGSGQGWFLDDVHVVSNPNRKPVADFFVTHNGLNVTAHGGLSGDADGDTLYYQWAWGDGAVTYGGTASSASHTYARPGVYAVTLTVTDGKDGSGKTSRNLTALPAGEVERFSDTLEWGESQWTKARVGGDGEWFITERKSRSPTRSYAAGFNPDGSGSFTNQGSWHLTTAQPVDLTGLATATLTYIGWVWTVNPGHHVVEVSTDGGATWTEAAPRIERTTERYHYEGDTQTVSLDAWAGQHVLIRFTWWETGGTSANFVDDVLVHGRPGASRAPVATFSIDAPRGSLAIGVDANGSYDPEGTALSYAWDWGDGTTTGASSSATATHTYGVAGTYSVTLNATDTGGTWRATTRTVQVPRPNAAPIATFNATTSGLNATVDATASSDQDGDALTYHWTFGDGTNATGATATHAYASSGTYTVTLSVRDGMGGSGTASKSVTVTSANTAPTAAFTWTRSGSVLSVNATGSSDPEGDALQYAWTWGDGTSAVYSASPTASRTYSLTNAYRVTLTVKDPSGLTSTISERIEVGVNGEAVAFWDDMENGTAKWSVTDNGGSGTWAITTHRYGITPSRSFGIGGANGYGALGNDALQTTAFSLVGASSARLNYRLWAEGQRTCPPVGGVDCTIHDSGYIELSTNGGATWSRVNSNPIVMTQSSSGGMVLGNFDISWARGNSNVLVRFVWTSDAALGGQGWFIDDVVVTRK